MSDDHAHEPDELELDPDEPHTPWWMPLLGGFIFLTAALGAVIAQASEDVVEDSASDVGVVEQPSPVDDHAGHGHD